MHVVLGAETAVSAETPRRVFGGLLRKHLEVFGPQLLPESRQRFPPPDRGRCVGYVLLFWGDMFKRFGIFQGDKGSVPSQQFFLVFAQEGPKKPYHLVRPLVWGGVGWIAVPEKRSVARELCDRHVLPKKLRRDKVWQILESQNHSKESGFRTEKGTEHLETGYHRILNDRERNMRTELFRNRFST